MYGPLHQQHAFLEEIRKARMKRKSSTHIVLIPRLMTPIWLKQCNKAADCIFHIPLLTLSGLLQNLNLSLLLYFFLILGTDLSNSNPPLKCSKWQGTCARCFKIINWTEGVFCANFYWTLGTYPPCHAAWCGSCYILEGSHHFHMNSPQTIDQESTQDQEKERIRGHTKWKSRDQDPKAFIEARNGDHIMTCIFRKLKQTSPNTKSSQDQLLLLMIRRMNLDAFWSRARSNVVQNT